MILPLLIFGLLGGCLLSILVGVVGSRRNIGFGWTFIISMIFTPLVGLIVALISDPLPVGERRWGCLATLIFVIVAVVALLILATVLFSLI